MKIAICYFGMSRSLATTLQSISDNIVAPCAARADVVQIAHLWRQTRLRDAQIPEGLATDPDDYRRLNLDAVRLQSLIPPHVTERIEAMKAFGDSWQNDFSSLRNLCLQLYSLQSVTQMAREYAADLVVFCRPDLFYHSGIGDALDGIMRRPGHAAAIPDWHHWEHGYNDRFSICKGWPAIESYGNRAAAAEAFVTRTGSPLHSERLLKFALEEARIPTYVFQTRASRVRPGGVVLDERFQRKPAKALPRLDA